MLPNLFRRAGHIPTREGASGPSIYNGSMPRDERTLGQTYLDAVEAVEAKCGADTKEWVKGAHGKRFPHAIDLLGRTLELIEKAAICHWGCQNPSHDLERLAARIYNLATGALQLYRSGRYDEALSLVRSIGEFVNLLTLFGLEPQKRAEWFALDDRKRRTAFGPGKVRIAIEAKQLEPAMDSDEYSDLCEQAVHPTPSARPGGYNADRLPVLGGHLQPAGAIALMCSLIRAIGRTAVVLSQLIKLPPSESRALLLLGTELESSLGGHTAASIRQRILPDAPITGGAEFDSRGA